MRNGRLPGLLGSANQCGLGETPGALGFQDHADPTFRHPFPSQGFTPGPLGIQDCAASSFLPTAGFCSLLSHAPVQRVDTARPVTGLPKISGAQLQRMFTDADTAYLDEVAKELSTDLKNCGLDTVLRLAHFFAQVREEAGPGLAAKVENLNYSPKALKDLFGYYKRHPEEADSDGYEKDSKTKKITRKADQKTIANKIYGDRKELGNGNIASEDGWNYRGRGFIQVTGRANYAALTRRYASLYGKADVDFEKKPDLVAEFPYTVRSAVCFWIEHKLHKLADKGATGMDVDRITKVVNFHTKSYDERREHFLAAQKIFV